MKPFLEDAKAKRGPGVCRLATQWAIVAALAAAVLAALPVVPALLQGSPRAALAGSSAVAASAALGALAGLLFQRIGRSRFWVLVALLSVASLALLAATGDIRRDATLVAIAAALILAVALSLWHLVALGLYKLRRKHR
jgi:hypothetical protein